MTKKGSRKKEKQNAKADAKTKEASPVSRGFPIWARILIVFVVLAQLGVVALASVSMGNIVQMIRQSMDPVFIKENAKNIAEFPEPLPQGFSFRMGTSLFNSSMVNVLYAPDQTEIMFGLLPKIENGDASARQLVDGYAEKGIPNVTDELKIDEKKKMDIAGLPFEYVLGTNTDPSNKTSGIFIACSLLNDKRAVMIFARTPSAKFNMDAGKKLFESIKNFAPPQT